MLALHDRPCDDPDVVVDVFLADKLKQTPARIRAMPNTDVINLMAFYKIKTVISNKKPVGRGSQGQY